VELRAFWKEWTQSGEHAVNERLVARGMAGERGTHHFPIDLVCSVVAIGSRENSANTFG
jgi:hypothetical protein